jgi:hypothetical protein
MKKAWAAVVLWSKGYCFKHDRWKIGGGWFRFPFCAQCAVDDIGRQGDALDAKRRLFNGK